MTVQLADLPNELLFIVVEFLGPIDNAHFQLTCHRFRNIAINKRLWREHCAAFKYWSPYHNYLGNLKKHPAAVDWKRIYCLRKLRNRQAEFLLRTIVNKRQGRLLNLEKLSMLGEDAKEYLLEQIGLDYNDHADALARRFHADVALGSMHRAMAISRWSRFSPNRDMKTRLDMDREIAYENQSWQPRDLEDIMSGFDMFAPTSKSRDITWSSQQFDIWAKEFKRENPGYQTLPTRALAVRLNQWLRWKKYVGSRAIGHNFFYLRALYLGQAIHYGDHMSIPLIQCTIYCAVAWRINLHADCCPFPGKLHVIVQSPKGWTVDGEISHEEPTDENQHLRQVIIDPYDKDEEVRCSSLQQALNVLSFHEPQWLQPARPAIIATRHARNIQAACERIHGMPSHVSFAASTLATSSSYNNVLTAGYASLWVTVLLKPSWSQGYEALCKELKQHVMNSWPEDNWILQRFLPPFTQQSTSLSHHSPLSTTMPYRPNSLEMERDESIMIHHRDDSKKPPLYRVGQVFRHAKYGTLAVITGWKPYDRGPEDTFCYYCLGGNNAIPALVRESHVSIVSTPTTLPDELINKCGKYFRNYIPERCEFVSNIRYQYPDD